MCNEVLRDFEILKLVKCIKSTSIYKWKNRAGTLISQINKTISKQLLQHQSE